MIVVAPRKDGTLPWEVDHPTLEELAALLRQPDWQRDGLCREPAYAAVNFFPTKGENQRPALACCAKCLVRSECLAFAQSFEGSNNEMHGVWGGTTARERKLLRKQRRAAQRGESLDAA